LNQVSHISNQFASAISIDEELQKFKSLTQVNIKLNKSPSGESSNNSKKDLENSKEI